MIDIHEVWIALLYAEPYEGLLRGCEFKGNGYRRVKAWMAWSGKGVGAEAHNLNRVTFPKARKDWGWATGFAICPQAKTKIYIAWGRLDNPSRVCKGGTAAFEPRCVQVRIT